MIAYFPISKPMVGSVIPGPLIPVRTRLANYQDHSLEPLIKKRVAFDPVVKFHDMNNEHGAKHPVLEKLRQMMSAGGPRHPHAAMGHMPAPQPQMREGYEPVRENLEWRRS